MSRSVENLNNCDGPTESFESGLSLCHDMYLVLMHVASLDHKNASSVGADLLVKVVLRVSLSRSGPSLPHHFQLHREHIDILHVYGRPTSRPSSFLLLDGWQAAAIDSLLALIPGPDI
jgi:hypothetical protein